MTIPGLTEVATQDLFGWGNIPKFSGDLWFVNAGAGASGDGTTPDTAFLTITEGLAAAAIGDAITITCGTYDEAGLDVDKDCLELWCEIGTVVVDTTPGTCLVVSGDNCRVIGLGTGQAGQIGFHVTGVRCVIEDCRARGAPSIGFDIDGSSVTLRSCEVGQPTATGYDLGANGAKLESCHVIGAGGSARGFYISAGDRCRLLNCTSIDNAQAGFETVSGSDDNLFYYCASGGLDGDRVDGGLCNFWPGFTDQMRREHHEHIYPPGAGEGVASNPVTVSNNVTDASGGGPWDDQDYWGDTVRIVPPDTIAVPWSSLGVYVHATTAADVQTWEVFFTNYHYEAGRDAGNAWDYQETALTVDTPTAIEADDKVWITGTGHLDGEICDVVSVVGSVVTIVSETRASGDTGLKYNYTGNEKMYVVRRADDRTLHSTDGDFSASGAREFTRYEWVETRGIEANGGMIMRMANATDAAASSFDVRAIYVD